MKLYATLILLCFGFTSFGQVGASFNEAKKLGISVKMLDKKHTSAINYVSETKVEGPFATRQEEFQEAYISMLQNLGTFLSKNNFKWEKPTKGFNRIYFNPDGSIAYFLYNFKPGEVTSEKENQFNTLLNQFIKTYKFPMSCEMKFAQCSPVTYMN